MGKWPASGTVRTYIICIWVQLIVSLNNHNSNIMIADYRFPVAQMVKNLPAFQKTWVLFLSWEDPWRTKWQTTPAVVPGEFHGWSSLAGYSPCSCKESDMTERLTLSFSLFKIIIIMKAEKIL